MKKFRIKLIIKLETKGKIMKNSFHHIKHFLKKAIRKNSHLPTTKQFSQDELIRRLKLYHETWGDLHVRPRKQVKQTFHAYIHYLTNHPSSVSPRHSRRSSTGTVDPDSPHRFMHSTQKEVTDHLQQKLQESNLKLSKKMMKQSKVRWKKID